MKGWIGDGRREGKLIIFFLSLTLLPTVQNMNVMGSFLLLELFYA